MSSPVPIEPDAPATAAPESSATAPQAPARSGRPDLSPRVRAATHADLPAVVAALRNLLLELGSTPPTASAMQEAARALLRDPRAGALIVAQAGAEIVGVLGASWQVAIHVPGRYALIQDLWVHRSWRGRAVGGELLAALFVLAREQGMARVEVGLPRERFQGIRATEAFYVHNGFAPLGARMRRILP